MKKEDQRYLRQVSLIGHQGQERLAQSKVLIVGMGGLGNAVLPILVGAGIGKIGIIDGDFVSVSNLHRQTLFSEQDCGNLKVEVARTRMNQQNPQVEVHAFPEYLTGRLALEIFPEFDIIVDATDRIAARYLINDACVFTGKPFVHAAIFRHQAQISTFCYEGGPTYRCLYPEAPASAPTCNETGVLGSIVSLAGSMQANEVLKMILGIGELASGKLLLIDGLTSRIQEFSFSREPRSAEHPELLRQRILDSDVERISVEQAIRNKGILLDVRNPDERPLIHSDLALNIPLDHLLDNWQELNGEKPVYVFCQSGVRASKAVHLLRELGINHCFALSEQAESVANYLTHEKENRIH